MILLRNDCIEYKGTGKVVRILWKHPTHPYAVIIDINAPKAMPEIQQIAALEDDLMTGIAQRLSTDPYSCIVNESLLQEKHKKIRKDAWELIQELVTNEPAIYAADKRWGLVLDSIEKSGSTHKVIYLKMRRYWQRSQTMNALLPDYANSGGKGKSRDTKDGVKRGRPRIYGDQSGLNVTPEIRKVFRVAVLRYYVSDKKFTFKGAFNEMIKDFFCQRSINPDTGMVTHYPNMDVAETGFPTFAQFNYWLDQDNDRIEIARKRMTPRVYDKDFRGLIGTSTAEVWGPGARYQIDATIADVFLVSRLNRNKIIGRPVLYVVIDTFSRMIVGIYVGLEGPSWVGAMMALANTASDKQAFCKKFGRIIEPEEWPCHYLPATLLGDRGEIEASAIEMLINSFNVTVENAAAYRADWKGIVEQRFKLLPSKFKPYVPGYIDVDYRIRGGKDYRLDAVLDLDQFTKIIIECALYYNNHHQIEGYDKDHNIAADSIATVPIDLWEWGIANSSGSLRAYPEDLVRFSLLPVEQATVTLNGIRFHGTFYTCQKAIQEHWFDRARQKGNWKVNVSYDPRDQDEIYLHDASLSMQFHVCQMTERSRSYRQMSTWEIEQQQNTERHISANHQPKQQLASADLAANIQNIVQTAVIQQPEANAESAASRTKNIRTHRAEEKAANRQPEAFHLGNKHSSQSVKSSSTATIVPFPGVIEDDYGEPDITEILATKSKDGDAKQ
ncbi:MAG: transposase family protein [Methylotenera sp.]|uniref:transposase family protein n=1 Tax=Methylotenera sp. TaxID=2051956 RepID=UPI00248898FD|nr:transposase family protein [Methylotenera sp.]MDI1308928.1 transposase family protein [Methylotenera sp.]